MVLTWFLQLLSLGVVINADLYIGPVPPAACFQWSGSQCKYKCRCVDNKCDKNGECIRPSTCVRGWFGPACQYVDLVITNTTASTPSWVYDFPDTLCSRWETVTITLQDTFYFTWLRLRLQPTGTSQAFKLQFTSNSKTVTCPNMHILTVSETVLDIHCDPGVWFQQLKITGAGVKRFCQVYISGGRNVALGQDTTQTSIYDKLSSLNAVDGNRNANYGARSCAHTDHQDSRPTWTLNFKRPHQVTRYDLYNRDSEQHRLRGFQLEAVQENGSMAFNYTDRSNSNYNMYRISSTEPQIPVLSVNIVATNQNSLFLTLCEVEMFGDVVCPKGKYGRECENSCDCAGDGETCFVSTGGCPSGCAAGYQGKTCSDPCSDTYYGGNCTLRCSSNCTDQLCNAKDGTCHSCVTGKAGLLCDQAQSPDDTSLVPVTVVLVISFVVLVALTVTGVFIWRRWRQKKDGGSQTTPATFLNVVDNESSRMTVSPPGATKKPINDVIVQAKVSEAKTKANTKDSQKPPDAYCNILPNRSKTAIRFTDLDDFIAEHRKEFFQQQFNLIPANSSATTTVALSAENQNKNRYKNISAYDHSRVHLQTDSVKQHGDYINASYIDGYLQKKQFIASQGPTKTILEDFVRMLWEQEVQMVVMLTSLIEDGKVKCEQYWPDDGEINIGEITVRLATTQVFADYTVRRLSLHKKSQPVQILTHFHFTTWPDKDVPTTAWGLVDLQERMASFSTSKPIVVHCSAGVGRTGTFIALHNILEAINQTGYMDVFTTVQKLRQDRINMVQTVQQYEFLHKAIQKAMVCRGTTVTPGSIRDRIRFLEENSHSGRSNLEKEFMSVCLVCGEDDCNDAEEELQENSTYYNSRMLSNRRKNRYHNVLPKEYYRPILRCETEDLGDYVNAVFIPSCKKHDHQILTQLPLPTTVADFWRLVTQYKVSLIVAFERDLATEDMTIGDYLPEGDGDTKTCSFLNIRTVLLDSCNAWKVHRVTITVKEEYISKLTNMSFQGDYNLSHLSWRIKGLDSRNLLTLMGKIRAMKPAGEGRMLFTCRNGAEFSGLASTLSLLLDKMDNDQHVSVPLAVGTVKAIRPQIVPTLDQYRLLYQAINLFTDTNNEYSNFGTR